jgi:glycosyltransferase involved in cell wall biosynthesis
MTKVALLTTFQNMPRQYGVVPVVENQMSVLSKFHDDETALFVVEGAENHPDFKRAPENIKVKGHVPMLHLYDYQSGTKKQTHKVSAKGKHRPGTNKNLTNFDKQFKHLVHNLEDELAEYDVIITHDIMFQTWFLVHNAAVREIGRKHPEIRWIHWCHSGPSRWEDKHIKDVHKLRFSGMRNSVFISPNHSMASGFAKMYNVPLERIKVIYHIYDPTKYFRHPLSTELVEKHDLLSPNILVVWPTRIDHLASKGIPLAVNLAAKLGQLTSTKMLFLNSWSSSEQSKTNIAKIKSMAENHGMDLRNLIFSSEMGKEYENGVPPEVCRDMEEIGNMFIFPSISETFSYALAQAAAAKNMLAINENLTVMKELVEDRGEYIANHSEWGGERITVKYDHGIETYCRGRAKELWDQMQVYKPLMQQRHVFQTFTASAVWHKQMKPIIEGTDWI